MNNYCSSLRLIQMRGLAPRLCPWGTPLDQSSSTCTHNFKEIVRSQEQNFHPGHRMLHHVKQVKYQDPRAKCVYWLCKMILEQNTCVYKLLRLEGKENKKQTMI